ncbi:HlyD family secretion protein [Rubellimicrobium arenae]|uniref:HlyD family secretion protein n=1 Tax=Rubellimicrobium arenae TaxID=2817372 RepID=UPI001B30F0C0|nr:HlyD family secretion protein [Rubellimicrobium arenae]
MKKHVPTLVAFLVGLVGVVVVLYAWQLPPFAGHVMITENAYVRGRVTTMSPLVAGHVTEVLVQDFQEVEAGQVLVRLDDRSLVQRKAQAQSQLAAAQAALASSSQSEASAQAGLRARQAALDAAQAGLGTAQSAAERAAELCGRGVIAQSEADQAQLNLDQATAALQQAQSQIDVAQEDLKAVLTGREQLVASVASAQAALELAEIDLENAVIRAPVAGRLGEVGARVGQYVTPGTSLMALVQHDVWIVANFKETQVSGMEPGQPVTFTVDAMNHRAFTGTIERFAPAMSSEFSLLGSASASGNFTKIAQRMPIRIDIDEGQERSDQLAPGMSVVVRVDTDLGPTGSEVAMESGPHS